MSADEFTGTTPDTGEVTAPKANASRPEVSDSRDQSAVAQQVHSTVDILSSLGTLVYESAILVMRIDEGLARTLLSGQLQALNLEEATLDIQTFAALMPSLEQRMRKALAQREVSDVMKRLNGFILTWEELGEAPHLPLPDAPDFSLDDE